MSRLPNYDSDVEPPAYDTVIRRWWIPDETPETLILDGCIVYSEEKPDRPLYETSNPVCVPSVCPIFAVQKYRYRVRRVLEEIRQGCCLDHIYDFKSDWTSTWDKDVVLVPKASSKRIHHDVKMTSTIGVMSFKVRPHFRVERTFRDRLTGGTELEWKDWEGKLVAVETRPERDHRGKLLLMPKLEIKVLELKPNDLDLLVTCWLARVWKQSEKDLRQPMTLAESKASQKVAKDSTGSTGAAL